jgi:hypothetical protein
MMDGEVEGNTGNTNDSSPGGAPGAPNRSAGAGDSTASDLKACGERARGPLVRHPQTVWIALAVTTAVLIWGANALAIRSVLDDAGALRGYLGNLQIFAVAITSAGAASVAWAGYGLGRARGVIPVWVLSLLASLAGLTCGLAISWGLAASVATGPARNLVVGALQLAGAIGAGFALVGAVVSDLSVGLATKASQAPTRSLALLHGAAIVMLSSLWVGAGIVAAGLARAQVYRP